ERVPLPLCSCLRALPPSARGRAPSSRPSLRPRNQRASRCPWLTACSSWSWCSASSLCAFDDLGEAVEPLQPGADALEGIGPEHAPADTADLLRRDELRLLEPPAALRAPGQRD